MVALLDILTLPGVRLYSILTFFFRTVRPILRCALLLSSSQKPPYLTLPHEPLIEYAPPQLEPPPAPSRSQHEVWSSTGSVSLKSGPQSEYGAPHLYGSAVMLVFGLLVLLVSVLLALPESSNTGQPPEKPANSHVVAEVYTSLTGRPYVASPWELMLLHQPSLERFTPFPLDVAPNLIFWDEASVYSGIEDSMDSAEEQYLSVFFPGRPPASVEPDIRGPSFAHLVNNRTIDNYLKLLTDEGYSEFKYRILDINTRTPNVMVVEWEFSARSVGLDVFMDATLRLTSLKKVPLDRTDFVLWDVGRGTFKAIEVLELAVSTREHVNETAKESPIFQSSPRFRSSAKPFASSGRSSTFGARMEAGSDSDESFFGLDSGPDGAPRASISTFNPFEFDDPFDDSSAETSADSDLYEESPADVGADSDDASQGSCSPSKQGGRRVSSGNRGRTSVNLFALSETPRATLFRRS